VKPAIFLGLAAVAATAASAALAAELPTATAVAEKGSLKIVSRALLAPKSAELMGVWLDARRPCSEQRRLRVSVLVDLVHGSTTTRRNRSRRGLVANCAEGGPNFGFTVTPSGLGMGCMSGRWKPGRYVFVVRTFDPVGQLRAVATLAHQETRRC
jgi:hypothetical protein